jgi:prepilin-type N-terminal cleavage/methylation domain-containing protein
MRSWNFKLLKARSGMTVTELLIAAVILGIATAGAVKGLEEINKSRNLNLGLTERHNIMNSIVDNIRSNASAFQMSYTPVDLSAISASGKNELVEQYLDPANLNYAWSNARIGTITECPECPGRYGYLIQPIALNRGLFLVTIRITNKELFEGFKQYQFLTTLK